MSNEGFLQDRADELASIVQEVLAGHLGRNSSEAAQTGAAEAVYRFRDGLVLRQEVVWNAWKLRERHYVDGNGGNLACRIGDEYVL